MRFLLAVRKHNFLRTSPAEAHNALIRMPAEMKRDGADVKMREEQEDKHRCPGICSPSKTQVDTCTNKAEWMNRQHRLGTEFILRVSQSDLVSETERIHESRRALSLAKWILHSAGTWYWISHYRTEYVLEWKTSVMLAHFTECTKWKLHCCHSGDKGEVMEGSLLTYSCYSLGHLRRCLWVSLRTNNRLLETQTNQLGHSSSSRTKTS